MKENRDIRHDRLLMGLVRQSDSRNRRSARDQEIFGANELDPAKLTELARLVKLFEDRHRDQTIRLL